MAALLCTALAGPSSARVPEGSVIITSVTPASGPTDGGTTVSIAGSGFQSGPTLAVTFGGVAAPAVSYVNANLVNCTTPAHPATGAVDVVLTNPDATTATLPGGFTYTSSAPAPTVSAVSPISGDVAGGTAVTITGTNFVDGAGLTVDFGGTQATSVTFGSSTSITCTTPPHSVGPVDVVVINPDLQTGTLPKGFTYTSTTPAPTVTAISPTAGPTTGGTSVTITGTNFISGATVSFGGTTVKTVTVTGSTSITCATPAHTAGTVDVVVANPDAQTGTLPAGFTYMSTNPAPTVASVSPTSGPTTGGTAVTITGTNFVAGAAVTFGGTAAAGVAFVSATSLTCTTPAHTVGSVNVVVTNPDAQTGTLPAGFTYTSTNPAPTVTAVSPTSGPTTGGTAVTVTGTNFVAGATVTFGGMAATGVAFVSAASLTCTTPAHAAGAVNVVVTNPDAQTGTLPSGFTYTSATPAPMVSSIMPTSGSTAGGTAVTISGANFQAGARAYFGGYSGTSISVASSSSITCLTPAHLAAVVDVTVTNPDAQSGNLRSAFTYVAPCDLSCTATVPGTGTAGSPVSFQGSASSTTCTGQPSFQWTFGDGQTSSQQSPSHTYANQGDFSWSLTATLQGTACSKYGTIHLSPAVPAPIITSVVKVPNPFRLKVSGTNFHVGCTVKINGVPVPTTTYKSGTLVVAKKGAVLKAMVPLAVPVQITVTNNDDGGVSAPYPYVR